MINDYRNSSSYKEAYAHSFRKGQAIGLFEILINCIEYFVPGYYKMNKKNIDWLSDYQCRQLFDFLIKKELRTLKEELRFKTIVNYIDNL
ncbi:hypothetical protein EW093_13050 [Thiospirochaeta perfilievii]|uniref:Uncharacterized protein n=1 Tax=Thiospirochaeta perfilievii TaxID=252967 RepID=A0A5C1QDF2_9SPIO|nr:hypothetical protein [Thiospirochaeta perfilievii]QEN05601.1 hypothetical protein EW093_13050 [Thiospirochaeta perfilievii]